MPSTEAYAVQPENTPLASIGQEFGALAAGLDAVFVRAGTALASAYEIVERLVGSLEGVTNAVNRDAADKAVETMRLTAERLTQLPQEQEQRQHHLAIISKTSTELLQHLAQIRRTLSFLQICGLNIKVTAAGADGFASFADHMSAKLEQAEGQVDEFENQISGLTQNIAAMVEADRLLMHECTSVIPRVPQKLFADAVSLQQMQDDSAALAEQIAGMAREIRAKVAVALGALQIGDITRQRLEHIAESVELVEGYEAEDDNGLSKQAEGHLIALLAAQAEDTVGDFLREVATLAESLRGLAPDAVKLADVRQSGSSGAIQQVLLQLESNIGEVASVTRQVCAAEADSAKLGLASSQAAESLSGRLKAVNRIQRDVEQMAWNTALQCRGLGADGRGIAVISEEIQSFSHRLADVWLMVSQSFALIEASAGMIGGQSADGAGLDTASMLLQSLDMIKDGSVRMAESLSAVDQEALRIGTVLDGITDDIACQTDIAPALIRTVADLNALREAAPEFVAEEAPDEAKQSLVTILGRIGARYTMASEREVHRGFLLSGTHEEPEPVAAPAGDDFDDFDDGLF
jgi:hypothetical protein